MPHLSKNLQSYCQDVPFIVIEGTRWKLRFHSPEECKSFVIGWIAGYRDLVRRHCVTRMGGELDATLFDEVTVVVDAIFLKCVGVAFRCSGRELGGTNRDATSECIRTRAG